MSLPALRLSLLRSWPSAPDIAAGLRRMLDDGPLVLPASLPAAERGEIIDLLVLFLDMPARVVVRPEQARSGELSILLPAVDHAPPHIPGGVLVCEKRRALHDRRLELGHQVLFLRDAIIESLGRQHSGTRLQDVAAWANEATDSPGLAVSFAAGAFAEHLDDPATGDAPLYTAGLVTAIADLLRGVDVRVAEWTIALATNAPHPGRLVSHEALLLGREAATLRALDAGLLLFAPEEPSDAFELRRPLELLRHLDSLLVPLSLADIAEPLGAALDPVIRLVFERLLRPEKKPLGLEGPKPVPGYVGREEVLGRLVALFEPANEIRTTVLYGVGGVGKRQVAAALGAALAPRLEPVWVRFTDGPEAGWLRVAAPLEIDVNSPDAATRDAVGLPRWVRMVHDALRFRPCLVVVEGVDEMPEDSLPAWLPSGAGLSTVLVLSHSAQRPLQRAHSAVAVKLGGLPREPARRLLADKVPRFENAILRGEVDTLIDNVGGNPGALTLAASLLERRSLEETNEATRRGEPSIPDMLREVVSGLPEDEATLLRALAVAAPAGTRPELLLHLVSTERGWEALERLIGRAMVVDSGRTVRLTEGARIEVERRLDRETDARRVLEGAHARTVGPLIAQAWERGDRAMQEDLFADLMVALKRVTSRCKAGDRDTVETLAGLAYELMRSTGGAAVVHAVRVVDAYRAVLAIEPGNTSWQMNLAFGLEKLGDAELVTGDTTRALSTYRNAHATWEHFIAAEPENPRGYHGLSTSYDRIGDVLLTQGDRAGALASYRGSLALRERMAQEDPADTRWPPALVASYLRVGDALHAQGDENNALVEYQSALSIAERFAREAPNSGAWQRDRAVTHSRIGDVLLARNDTAGAIAAHRAALAVAERMARQDPANTEWQQVLSGVHERTGNALFAAGDKAGATDQYRTARTLAEQLAQGDPANMEWQGNLADGHQKMGDALLAQEDRAGAVAAYQASLAIRERLGRQDPANANGQANLAYACWKLADVLATGGPSELAEARGHWERARRILGNLASHARLTHEQQGWLPRIEARLKTPSTRG